MRAAGAVDRESCRAWVESENKAVGAGTAGSKHGEATAATGEDDDAERLEIIRIPLDFVLPLCLPTNPPEVATEERREHEVPEVGDFAVFKPEPLNERLDYKVLNYPLHSHTLPPASFHMQLHTGRRRLDAAREEHLVRGPRGEADAADVPMSMPASCLLPPSHDALSLLVPSTECRTYVPLPEATEGDPEFWLSKPPPLIEPLKTEPLLPEHIMSLERPWLEVWRSRRELADPFQLGDPWPCSFAEAGGSLGPRLGCDAGGERLSFMPVGGFARDIPSDTDDDGKEELEMPPPTDDEYKKALADLDGPVDCERWRKERAAEEHLRRICDANSKAVRKRLEGLNEELEFGCKLFLG